MSLQNNDNILDTTVSWNQIEATLQKTFKTTMKFGLNKSAERIGEGQGFMSKMALLMLDWEDEHLPKQVVVKITHLVEEARALSAAIMENNREKYHEASKKLHNAEMSFYENASPRECLPRFYGGERFTDSNNEKGFFVMEYIPASIQRSIYHKVEISLIETIVKEIAEIASESLINPEKFDALIDNKNVLQGIRQEYIKAESIRGCMTIVKEQIPDTSKDVEILLNKIDELLDIEVFKNLEHFNGKGILSHGDLWAGNVLFNEVDGQLHLNKIIDFQTVQITSPSVDFYKLFNLHLTTEVRDAHTNRLIKLYFDTVKSKCKEVEIPFTVDQLIENYEKQYPIHLLAHIGFFPGMLITFTKNCDQVETRRRQAIIKEMMCGMVKSGVKYLEKHY